MNSSPIGDTAFFNAVYQEHNRVIYAFLLGQCGDAESAADLLQETFLRVWRHLADMRQVPAARRRFYLFAMARNLVVDERRRRAVRQRLNAEQLENAHLQTPATDLVQGIIAQETVAAVDEAIRRLPPDLRTVLSLHLMAEMNSGQIGRALDIPASTVRYRLSRARECIRESIREENES